MTEDLSHRQAPTPAPSSSVASIAWIRRFLAPPVFADPLKTKEASLVSAILLTVLLLWPATVVVLLVFRVANVTNAVFALSANVLLMSLWLPLRLGHVRLTAVLLFAVGWVATTAQVYNQGNVTTVNVLGYVNLSVIAGLLFDRRGTVAASLINVGTLVALSYAENAGLLPPPLGALPRLNLLINVSTVLIAVAALTGMARSNLLHASERAEHENAERVRAQGALQRRAARLAEAERLAHVGSWEKDLITGEYQASDELYRIFGVTPEEVTRIGEGVWRSVHPDDYLSVAAAWEKFLAQHETLDLAYRIVRQSGQVRSVHSRAEVFRGADGSAQFVRGVLLDVTEQERIKQILSDHVRELFTLHQLAQVISYTLPPEEFIRTYLDRLVELVGFDVALLFLMQGDRLSLAGLSTSQPGSHEAPVGASQYLCEKAVLEREPQYLSHPELTAVPAANIDGYSEVRSLGAFPLSSGGEVVGGLVLGSVHPAALSGQARFLETIVDQVAGRLQNVLLHLELQKRAAGLEETVTERTRELQTERDRTQAILETVGESVVVTDNDGLVLFMNPATNLLTGYDRDEILGQPLWFDWSAETLAEVWSRAKVAVNSGQAWYGEIEGRRKDGSIYVAGLTGTALYDGLAAAEPVGGVWVQRDITPLKDAARLKDKFVSNVSHELRTPISIIGLGCDNLEAFYDQLNERQRLQMIQDIHEQAHLLNHLTEDVLQIAQIDGGAMTASMRHVDLMRLVQDEVDSQRYVADRRHQKLSVGGEGQFMVFGNEGQLKQVVRNLLDNAIKYTPEGGHISCDCKFLVSGPRLSESEIGTKSWAAVAVSDNGIGIASEDLPFVFERFYRVQAEGQTPGTGLGLSIARELALRHGGWIEVSSRLGLGSTFTLYLPRSGDESNKARTGWIKGGE